MTAAGTIGICVAGFMWGGLPGAVLAIAVCWVSRHKDSPPEVKAGQQPGATRAMGPASAPGDLLQGVRR